MLKDTHKTKVIFRRFKNDGSVIAIFPEMPGTNNWAFDCGSYEHIGQHGACSVHIAEIATLATPEEYKDLRAELESIGYDLEVINRIPQNAWKVIRHQIEKVA